MKTIVIPTLQKMIEVNTPIIYINDYDFARVDNIIYRAIQNKKVYEWNPVTGRTNFFNKESEGLGAAQTLENFLHTEYIQDSKQEKFLVLKEIQEEIDAIDAEEAERSAQAEMEAREVPAQAQLVNGNITASFQTAPIEQNRNENPTASTEYRQAFMNYIQRGTPIPT